MNPVELYTQLEPAEQRLFDEVNFLATELRDHLVLEQFYLALSALTTRLQRLHPEIPCATACSRCCETYALPELLPMEWELVRQALECLDVPQRQSLQRQVQQVSAVLDTTGNLPGKRADYPHFTCPLLLEGRCAVYAMRPFDCRITGYSFACSGERPLPLQAVSRQPVPYTCAPEQQRMLADMRAQKRPLHYMFLPQKDKLEQVLKGIEPSPDAQPRLLLAYLREYFLAD